MPRPARAGFSRSLAGLDRRVVGIGCILASAVAFPLSDLSAQSLMATLPPIEVAWLRYCVFCCAALTLLGGGRGLVRTGRPALQVLRGVMTATSTLFALVSFKMMPVADATAIGFVCPVFVTALAVVVLKEAVGLRRWLAALAALGGVVIIVQPGGATFQPAALLPLVGAVASAVAVICTRLIKGDDPRTTVLYTAVIGTLVLTVAAAPNLVMPSPAQWPVVIVVGLFGAMGTALQIVGYRLAPASLLSPFTYVQLIVASGLSFVTLGLVPSLSMALGAAVIAGAAITTALRERARGVAA